LWNRRNTPYSQGLHKLSAVSCSSLFPILSSKYSYLCPVKNHTGVTPWWLFLISGQNYHCGLDLLETEQGSELWGLPNSVTALLRST
jgi:hypothetical protein